MMCVLLNKPMRRLTTRKSPDKELIKLNRALTPKQKPTLKDVGECFNFIFQFLLRCIKLTVCRIQELIAETS